MDAKRVLEQENVTFGNGAIQWPLSGVVVGARIIVGF